MYIYIIAFLLIIFLTILLYSKHIQPKNQLIRSLARQCARWSVAAQQDKNAIIRLLHANYGAGYLWAIEDNFTSQEFELATGLKYIEFKGEILKIQDSATRNIVSACSTIKPTETILLRAMYGFSNN